MNPVDDELPNGWTRAALGDIADEPEQYVPKDDESFDYIDIGAVDRAAKVIRSPQRLLGKDAPSRARKKVATGDTLVSMTRPNLNAVALVPEVLDGQIASTGFDVLRPRSGVDPRWLGYSVRTENFVRAMSDLVQGALNPAVRTMDVRGYVAPLAPTAEQLRIADQLDTLLARIQACNDRLDAIPALLKRFRQVVLDAAVAGHLSSDQSSSGKTTVPLSDICLRQKRAFGIGPFGSDLKVADYRPSGVPLVFVRDIRARRFGGDGTKYVSADKAARLAAHTALPGDLLVTKMGDPPGDTAIYPDNRPPAVITADVVRMRVNPEVANARFVGYWFESTGGRRLVATITAGVAQRKVSLERLKTLQVDLPDTETQDRVVRIVESLFGLMDRIEARHSAAIAQAQRLIPLTLAKAFRGELVPQDPNDEPASALLARFTAQRLTSAAKPKTRQPSRAGTPRAPKETAAMTKSRQDDDVMDHPYLADHLRRLGTPATAEALFRVSELPVADFYKQLAWEVAQGHVTDNKTTLEPGHAA